MRFPALRGRRSVMKFPKQIFVRQTRDRNIEYLVVGSQDTEDAEDGEKVAIYILEKVLTKKVQHSLE